jgi:hypothetical protein
MAIRRFISMFTCALAMALTLAIVSFTFTTGRAYADNGLSDSDIESYCARIEATGTEITDTTDPYYGGYDDYTTGEKCRYVIDGPPSYSVAAPALQQDVIPNCGQMIANYGIGWQYQSGSWIGYAVSVAGTGGVKDVFSATVTATFSQGWTESKSVTNTITVNPVPGQLAWVTLGTPQTTLTGHYQLFTPYVGDPLLGEYGGADHSGIFNTADMSATSNSPTGVGNPPVVMPHTSYMTSAAWENSCGGSVSKPSTPGSAVAVAGDGDATVTVAPPPASYSSVLPGGGSTTAISGTATALGSGPIDTYTVTADPGGQTCTVTETTDLTDPQPPLLSCTVPGLSNGTAYTFTTTAANAAGPSAASAPSQSVTPSAPDQAAPGPPSATAMASSALVSVTPPSTDDAIDSYTVTADPGGQTCTAGRYTLMGNTCMIDGLAPGTTYTFAATATSGIGTSPPSPPSTPITTPGTPPLTDPAPPPPAIAPGAPTTIPPSMPSSSVPAPNVPVVPRDSGIAGNACRRIQALAGLTCQTA